MMVGIIYGLTFQALALSKLGRHAEAIAASDEAIQLLDNTRTDLELVWRWRAGVYKAAGQLEVANSAIARANAEVDAKAQKLRDPDMRKQFLASRQRTV
jgi:tetratricopeptide (TPR) repeat protein